MEATKAFGLKLISVENGIATVGDGAERFDVREAGLTEQVMADGEDEIRAAYDAWCANWAV